MLRRCYKPVHSTGNRSLPTIAKRAGGRSPPHVRMHADATRTRDRVTTASSALSRCSPRRRMYLGPPASHGPPATARCRYVRSPLRGKELPYPDRATQQMPSADAQLSGSCSSLPGHHCQPFGDAHTAKLKPPKQVVVIAEVERNLSMRYRRQAAVPASAHMRHRPRQDVGFVRNNLSQHVLAQLLHSTWTERATPPNKTPRDTRVPTTRVYRQPLARAHFITSAWPYNRACWTVVASHGHPMPRNHRKICKLP